MVKSPLWTYLLDILNDYVKFMDDYFKEAADLTFLGYRHRNYTKVSTVLSAASTLLDTLFLFIAFSTLNLSIF